MPTGPSNCFNTDRGYGFITNEAGGPDAFVHVTAVEAAGMGTLRDGQKVSFVTLCEPIPATASPRRVNLAGAG